MMKNRSIGYRKSNRYFFCKCLKVFIHNFLKLFRELECLNRCKEVNLKEEVTNAQFYVNPEGVIVLSFNECSVAPAYMGVVQFEVRPAELEGILK